MAAAPPRAAAITPSEFTMPPSSHRSRRCSILSLSIYLGVLATAPCLGCSGSDSAARERETLSTGARAREAPRVRIAPLEQREMVQVLETTTVLESDAEVSLVPRTSGLVV